MLLGQSPYLNKQPRNEALGLVKFPRSYVILGFFVCFHIGYVSILRQQSSTSKYRVKKF